MNRMPSVSLCPKWLCTVSRLWSVSALGHIGICELDIDRLDAGSISTAAGWISVVHQQPYQVVFDPVMSLADISSVNHWRSSN